MAFTSDQLAKLTRDASSEPQADIGVAATWGQRLFDLDLAAVHLFSRTARSAIGRFLAVAISKLGNGWIYLILAPIVLIGLGWQGLHVAALAGLNAALLHMLYPIIKRRFGRRRPFHVDARLPSLLKTLDDHSFPSGHAMTLTGVLAPIVIAWPGTTLSAGLLLLSMAWSRIATAHHYPSDVAAGVALGAGLSYPLARGILAYW
ncbi:phosphatase PAP2 family protein [Methylocystis sp. L43]|jgi:undecaprenyl-diphosphatase|uniref:phosphatase PAP2 family protein n=1 Tax=unclassified Methylocystis TaxID=2625913 RepID=UPI0018C2D51F|nr:MULTISPECIES: phosphatase PAP2 family protein [unclassified Methylocystis]MBG0798577.1 phosphatase PAP2 family protein [Methylocystis sp. L43]MBG0806892.1 phosphatase PAP2 family protein [Methylocystis sp. H15]